MDNPRRDQIRANTERGEGSPQRLPEPVHPELGGVVGAGSREVLVSAYTGDQDQGFEGSVRG